MTDFNENILLCDNDSYFDQLSKIEAINMLKHIRLQFKTRYKYLIGEWVNAHRAKDTTNGRFASKDEVIEYLDS